MGLDYFSIVMEVEREFGVKIPSEDWLRLVTAGDLLNRIQQVNLKLQALLPAGADSGHAAGATFCWLRSSLRSALEDSALRVRPSDTLNSVVPRLRREEIWSRWKLLSQLPLPSLERSHDWQVGLRNSAVWIGWGSLFASFGLALTSGRDWLGDRVVIGSLLLFPCGIVVTLILLHVRDCLPSDCIPPEIRTFRDLVQWQLPLLQAAATARAQPLETEEVWRRLRRIIHNVLHVPEEEIQLHSRFVEDLGCE